MGIRKTIAKLLMGTSRGLNPNSHLALERINKKRQIEKLERELYANGRNIERDGSNTILDEQRTSTNGTIESVREPPKALREEPGTGQRRQLEDDRRLNATDGDLEGEMMDFDTMIGAMTKFTEFQSAVAKSQAEQRRAIKEELLESMEGAPMEEPGDSFEEKMMETIMLKGMQQTPQAPPPISDGTPPPQIQPSTTETVSVPEVSGKPFTKEDAVIVAQDLATRMPKKYLKMLPSIPDGVALSYLAAYEIPEVNSRMILAELRTVTK